MCVFVVLLFLLRRMSFLAHTIPPECLRFDESLFNYCLCFTQCYEEEEKCPCQCRFKTEVTGLPTRACHSAFVNAFSKKGLMIRLVQQFGIRKQV